MNSDANIANSEDFFRKLAEYGSDVITVISEDGTIIYNNPALERTLGFTAMELNGQPVGEFLHPADHPEVSQVIAKILSGEAGIAEAHFRFRHKAGGYRTFQAIGRAWEHDSKKGILVHSRDVTQQVATQRSLALSDELRNKMFATSTLIMSITNQATGEFIEVNDAWCRITGYSREDAIGHSAIDLGIWGPTSNRQKVIDDLTRKGMLSSYELTTYSRDGDPCELVADIQSLTVEGEQQILLAALDVSKTKRVEEELRQAQKMDAMGQLTGGVAHDFNNLIGVTLGNAELMLYQMAEDSTLRPYTEHIIEASRKAAELTRQLLAFSRRQPLSPEPIQLGRHVRAMLPLLSTTFSENTELRVDIPETMRYCNLDPTQFESALLNLALNARDAMPAGGSVCISLKDLPQHDVVQLSISDTGVGIAPEVKERIFDPFFTTKTAGKGTGLGLSMVFGFVNQSGGQINFESVVGNGTIFSMRFPTCAPPERITTTELPRLPKPEGKSHYNALVIEDNEPLRELVCEFLHDLGYVVGQSSGEGDIQDAVDTLGNIDLIVTDVILKGQATGTALAEQILNKQPAKVLVITGYAAEGSVASADLVLSKPFSRQAFISAVQKLRC
ncbi:MAG: PAS domain S-box protein [Pseudomonadota bacterium]